MRPLLLLAPLALAACNVDRAIAGDPDLAMPDMTCVPLPAPKIDVLFMIDNSNSTASIHDTLSADLPNFIKIFNDFGTVDVNFGVVTSDYGAGSTGAPGCQASPGGQRGVLQGLGSAANGCQTSPATFARYTFGGSNNLPPGQDLATTLSCMTAVGSIGCGFESPLESVFAALHNDIPENAGFLRPDAVLVVIFITNEDDCSAPPTSALFDKGRSAEFGYEDSYRCTRFGIVCNGQAPPYGPSTGPLVGCTPAPEGNLFGVQRYIDFFTRPASQGGVKDDPLKVILAAIDAPSDPFEIIMSDPWTPVGAPYAKCDPLNEASNPPCVPVLQHSCGTVSGDPAIRLNTVVSAASNHRIHTVCDANFSNALQDIARAALTAATCR